MKEVKKVLLYGIIYLLIMQIGLIAILPPRVIYDYRMNYELVKDRSSNIEAVFAHVKRTIEKEKLKDYVVIIGDSVGYSRPGPANASIGYYLEQRAKSSGKSLRVFNLSMPAMQMGDVYTILLKMKQYDISSDHIIINLIYAGFIKHDAAHPIVTWFPKQLKELDPQTYKIVADANMLRKDTDKKQQNIITRLTEGIRLKMYEKVSLFKYKDYMQLYVIDKYKQLRGKLVDQAAVQPWYEKKWLKNYLKKPVYQREFSEEPFIMDESNFQIYFLNQIMDMQKGKDTLIFMAAINDDLMKDNVEKPGFQENLKKVDLYFADKPVQYINFNEKIDNSLFTDHVHLLPKGYKYLSDQLWDIIEKWGI